MPYEQPETVDVYVHAQASHYDGQPYRFCAFSADMSVYGYIPVAKVAVPIPRVSQSELDARQLVLLRAERTAVLDKAHKEIAPITERINKLEALGYNPTEPL